jgi:hypothetical protein
VVGGAVEVVVAEAISIISFFIFNLFFCRDTKKKGWECTADYGESAGLKCRGTNYRNESVGSEG